MPPWDETAPATERTTFARSFSWTNAILGFGLATLIASASAVLLRFPDPSAWLRFTWAEAARGGELWRFATYPFAHAMQPGPLLAFGLMSLALFRFGNDLEREWGGPRVFGFYLASSLYGALAHAAYQVLRPGSAPGPAPAALEGCGPTLAVILAYASLHPRRSILFLLVLPVRPPAMFALSLGAMLVFGVGFLAEGLSPFAMAGSVAAAGAILALEPRFDAWLDIRDQRAARARYLEEVELRQEVDRLLDKIHRVGLDALTARERRILQRASRLYGRDAHE